MPIPGNLMTTAMAVMPHTDVDRAIDAALTLDIPFWPQLPHLSYYEDMYVQAAEHFPGIVLDLDLFFSTLDRPRGIHLCGNPDWDFLLGLDMDILSLDIYTNADIFGASTRSVKLFLDKGGIMVWGIVPTGMETFETENQDLLAFRLKTVWKALDKKGIPLEQILAQSLISPATCCLVNKDREKTVEKAFQLTRFMSETLREAYKLT